jgi:undecaprenyl-diphosphatase
MIQFLYNIDVQIFYFINKTLANPVTDSVMPFITEINHWKIFYVIMWLYLMIGAGKKGRIVGVLVLLLILASDQLSSNLIKHLVDRVRPCNVLPGVHLLVGCTESYSFPSSHAVNHFAAAVFFSHFYPRLTAAFYTTAVLMTLSRIFCGVHYPSDVLGGAILGIIVGAVFIKIWTAISKKIKILRV